jgi:hypothetical protein
VLGNGQRTSGFLDKGGSGDELTIEFVLSQQRIDPLGQTAAPGFLLDVPCLLPLLVDLHPAIRQLTCLDLLRVEPLIPMCPHQFLDLLPVPQKERGAILERRWCAVALTESLRGWIPIIAPQFQLASASCPWRWATTRIASRDSSGGSG